MESRPYRRGKNRCLICGKKLSYYHTKNCPANQKLIKEVSGILKRIYGDMFYDMFDKQEYDY